MTMEGTPTSGAIPPIASRIAEVVGQISGVIAVSLGGSVGSGLADADSDFDFHVFWTDPLASPTEREAHLATIADAGSIIVRPGTASWELEDWFAVDGRLVELIYVAWRDVEADVASAYDRGLTDAEFTTARLHNYAHGHALHDPTGVLRATQERLNHAYPEATRDLLLRREPERLAMALKHLRTAQARRDVLFAQHRRYTVQAIFFNLLFALNRLYHPGEKRLLTHAERCPIRPADCAARWEYIALLPADDMALEYFFDGNRRRVARPGEPPQLNHAYAAPRFLTARFVGTGGRSSVSRQPADSAEHAARAAAVSGSVLRARMVT
jgi:hypothetical protein